MRPEWRLATNSLSARRSRTFLLIAAVALSAAMIAAVSCAMASITKAIGLQLDQTVGRAELRLKSAGRGGMMPASALETARGWSQTQSATGRASGSLTILFRRWALIPNSEIAAPASLDFSPQSEPVGVRFDPTWQPIEIIGNSIATGIDPDLEPSFRALTLVEGRWPRTAEEIVVDASLVDAMGRVNGQQYRLLPRESLEGLASPQPGQVAINRKIESITAEAAATANLVHKPKLGDTLLRFRVLRDPQKLKIVGIAPKPPLGVRWQAYLTLEGLAALTGQENKLSEVDIKLKEGIDPDTAVEQLRPSLGPQYLLQTTERITSSLNNNMKSNELGFVLATVMAFLAASFIIMTGLSTGLTEKERELSVLRCIGATRWQLSRVQLFVGAIIGGVGGLIGVPLGVLFAFALATYFREQLPTGLHISPVGLATALVGAVGSGLAGAAFPAWRAARVSPLEGLSARAKKVKRSAIFALLGAAVCLLLLELGLVFLPTDGQTVFWGYATLGLPAMFIGYFLLGVPTLLLVSLLLGRLVNAALLLPAGLLNRNIVATPYRYGFTASAMMSGLAIMVALWTQGRSIMNDWLGRFEFPDAFVTGLSLTPAAQQKLETLPFITGTCAITLQPISTDAFGVKALQRYKSMFIAFEPEPFFRMTRLTWVEPTTKEGQERAERRLSEGGAILVAREFQVAQGVKLGDSFKAIAEDRSHEFEIVGVVTSPGLEVVSKFFSIGEEFTDQAIHAVFGSRNDLKDKFQSEAINLIQIGLKPDTDDQQALMQIRTVLADSGALDVGSGKKIKEDLRSIIGASLVVASAIAVFAMLVASFGVANIIIAGIYARRFEFGVLRAIGASRGTLVRLVLGEAIIIAITAILLGTALGLQGIISGQRLDRMLFGLELTVKPPIGPIAVGWAFVTLVTLLAAAPAAFQLGRKSPRELLASMRG